MNASAIDAETIEVREMHRFDEAALAAYMRAHVPAFSGALQVRQFSGGESNPTFLLRDGSRDYVLRKKPPGKLLPSAHQVDREYRIMTALQKSDVPVPETYNLCQDESVIGTAFFLMQKVEGRVLRDPLLRELEHADRGAYYDHFIRSLAALHTIDIEARGLGDFGRPGSYFERQIGRWSKQYTASQTEDIGEMAALMNWLPKHIPEDDSVSVVHGDYRPENSICHASEPEILAIVDWELSTLGHPLGDLGYCCTGYHGHWDNNDPDAFHIQDHRALGLPTEAEFVARYCELTGRSDIPNWYFYIVFSQFRSAAIVQGVYKRGLDGIAASPRALGFRDYCRIRAETAWRLVEENN